MASVRRCGAAGVDIVTLTLRICELLLAIALDAYADTPQTMDAEAGRRRRQNDQNDLMTVVPEVVGRWRDVRDVWDRAGWERPALIGTTRVFSACD